MTCKWVANRGRFYATCGEESDTLDAFWNYCPFCGEPVEDATEYEPDTWGPDADAHCLMEGK